VQQSGWYQTQPGPPSYSYIFPGSSGTNHSGLNFGDFQLVTLTGQVYNDLNGDGKKQGKEPGLAGWTVNLLDPSGNVAFSAVTDSSGNYSFNGVFPGTFTVAEVLQSGWTQTQPVNPPVYTVTTQSGHNVSGLVFGDHHSSASKTATKINSGSLQSVPGNVANGKYVAIDGVSIVQSDQALVSQAATQTATTGANADIAIGTLDMSQPQPIGVNASAIKKDSGNGLAAAPTIPISGVTKPSEVTVYYDRALPPQGNQPGMTSLVDLVLSHNSETSTKNEPSNVIGSLALDLLRDKRVKA
jgi:hypothetical protein